MYYGYDKERKRQLESGNFKIWGDVIGETITGGNFQLNRDKEYEARGLC